MENKIKNLRKNLGEDDLLEQQAEFLRESKDPKFQPTVSKLYKSEQVIREQENRPKYDEPSTLNVFMPLNIVEHDTSRASVKEIEKSMCELVKMDDKRMKCDLTSFTSTSGGKKKSLFAQYMESKRQKLTASSQTTTQSTVEDQSTTSSTTTIDGSGLYADKDEARRFVESVSKQNDELLSRLSDAEKRRLIEQFREMSTSGEIKFKPKRSNESNQLAKQLNESTNKVEKDYVSLNVRSNENDRTSDREQLNPYIDADEVKKNKWLNMDRLEVEKFDWMRPLIENEKKRTKADSVENKAARFNFDGDLIVSEEEDVRKGLHHHSEQDTSSGYTINELITLTQSKYVPQRILALNTLANIFRRMHRGYFDICFDKSLTIELIEQTETLILLRRLLDDANVSLQLVTIKCIQSLVCNTIYDEFCLDRLFCSMELGIEIPKLSYAEQPNEKELKDEQLCRLDVISCLIRMNVLPRLRYLLDNLQTADPMLIDNIMDILIRICRHSAKSCNQLIETPYLLECLINNFIASPTSPLNWKALKVIRILFTTDKGNIVKVKRQFSNLWIVLCNYLIMNPPNDEGRQIYPSIIEVLRVWRVLLILDNESNETTDQFKCELASNIKCCLNMRILTNNSFDLHYVSNLLHCLAYVIQKLPLDQKLYFEGFFTPLVQDLAFRWFREMNEYNQLPKLDGCLAVASALLYLNWSFTSKEQLVENVLKPILNSTHLMRQLTDQLLTNSSILNFREYHNSIYRDSKALPSYGSIYFGGSTIKLNQLLNEESIIFLIGPLIGLTAKHQLSECLEQFIYHSNVRSYLNKIVKQMQKSPNWTIFELIEFNPVSQLILWERTVLNKSEYFDHALSILSSVGDLQLKQSLCEYVFDVKQYKLIYDKGEFSTTADQLIKTSICFFNEIKKVYSMFSTFEDRNWIFEPLVKLYRIQLSADCQLTEDELVGHLTGCLNYLILLYNLKPNYLWSLIEPKVLFVYLTSVFLFRNGLFLSDELSKILKYFLIDLTSHQNKISFNCYEEQIPEPFHSIGDHFNSLCISYKTDSYGNYLFSNYLLCFITQSSDKIFRKKLLDEHSACLNYFILNNEQLLIDLESLINPIERDLSIVESYVRILMAKDILKQRNPLIYEIACTHVSKSLFDDQYAENRLQNNALVQKLINCLKLSNNNQLKVDLNLA